MKLIRLLSTSLLVSVLGGRPAAGAAAAASSLLRGTSGSGDSDSNADHHADSPDADAPAPAAVGKNENRDRDLETRIIGGSAARVGRYPYAASLQDWIGHFCGASLIARDVVLTAAHCRNPFPYDVVVGRHDLTEEGDGAAIPMARELPHPGYDGARNDLDFMLVFLERPANAQVVSLNPHNYRPSAGQGVTVMGWGDFDAQSSVKDYSDVLRSVDVSVVSNQVCDASEGRVDGRYDSYKGQITSNMLCAGHASMAKDSCQGDSGGPLVIRGADAGADVQVGVVSWGAGCAHREFPGVYARISRVYPWIEREVCKGSKYAARAGFDCIYANAQGGTKSNDFMDVWP